MIHHPLPCSLRDKSDDRITAELTALYGPGRIFHRWRDVVWWVCYDERGRFS